MNLLKCFGSTPDKQGYCVYELSSAKSLYAWFSFGKALVGLYPSRTNQISLWIPEIPSDPEETWYARCFAFVLADNCCVVTKFEANNPVAGAPEVFADNPLCSANPAVFWNTTLDSQMNQNHGAALKRVTAIK